ncbi:hypothetical protein [Undibacterium sp. TS12]|uniref:hypothetical protein n=1 Tax=Undibacterium sp. TS12 TaxID=2908202 RepID=UPI001F4C6193|nr:hypothetical protein [Undibacterium sp. TS12]MCH8622512.1 hypothetical protein [Undibacterium sp. TS12]
MKIDIAQRYAQVAQLLSDKFLFTEEIQHALHTSNNYTRKLLTDLCYSGHLVQERVRVAQGRFRSRFRWQAGKAIPTSFTRQNMVPKKQTIRRTDPLMIALYGEA